MRETVPNGLHDLAEDLAAVITEAWVAAKPEIDAARAVTPPQRLLSVVS